MNRRTVWTLVLVSVVLLIMVPGLAQACKEVAWDLTTWLLQHVHVEGGLNA
jgi:hypothetical protein